MTRNGKKRRGIGFESRVVLLAVVVAMPWVVASLVLISMREASVGSKAWLVAGLLVVSAVLLAALRNGVAYPLRTLSNLLSSLREEDYSFRARIASADDAMGEVMTEVNELTEMLRGRRLSALEASALLRTVIAEIDSAIFAFDQDQKLRLVNRAGERLLARPSEILSGLTANELGLASLLEVREAATVEKTFPGGTGRWGVRQSEFREEGKPHRLLVVTDLSRALREEERQAWKRLLRVLGHELNNSLAPIKSIAGSMETLVNRDPLPDDFQDDLRSGLAVIRSRTEALARFMDTYSTLARLPQPRLEDVDLASLVRRVAALERRADVTVTGGPDVRIRVDPDQIEQLLINLVRNAVDAVQETGGAVELGWDSGNGELEVELRDEGPGISGSTNLFVPFYTTKPGGTGIGLVLCRQIAEAHGGTLTLANRSDRTGSLARLILPL
jgi:nitrogen fixation/metabolism regulation signal transduction histidine kinase